MSFAKMISDARKKAGLSQRELMVRIKKEDGTPISPQYLNDLEHGRRNPPGPHMLKQFAAELGLDYDVLFFEAGQYPEDVHDQQHSPERVKEAFQAFRRKLTEE